MQDSHILVVDDEEKTVRSASLTLRREGMRVSTAANGRDALLVINGADNVDVLVCDLSMPEMTGQELMSELQEEGRLIPTLVITGAPDMEMVRFVSRRFGCRVLNKPFEPEDLVKSVQLLLDNVSPFEVSLS